MIELIQRFRPRLGWPTFFGVLTLGICFPLAIVAGRWVDDSGVLVVLGLMGGILGSWLPARPLPARLERRRRAGSDPDTTAHSGPRLSDRMTWIIGLGAGVIITFMVIGDTVPPISLLFQNYAPVEPWSIGSRWVDPVLRAVQPIAMAISFYLYEFALRNSLFATQIGWWVNTALTGGASQDNDIFLLLMGWLSWGGAFHAMAMFTLQRSPTWALVPLGGMLTVAVAGSRGGNGWLYAFLGLGIVLWAQGAFLRRERRWAKNRIDYSPEIRLDVFMVGFAIALLVVLISAGLAWGVPWAGNVLRGPLSGPTQRVATTLDRLFGGVRKPPSAGGEWVETNFGDLPLSRVLAGPPELRDDPVLKVEILAPAEPDMPRTYWRGWTYDQYTGRGWANSAGEIVRRPPRPTRVAYLGPEITQHVEILSGSGPVRYAAAQPLRVDVDATWITRDSQDLVGWYADPLAYTVVSRPTMASIEALRNAPTDYPDWVLERYLQLPEDLPLRVRQKAEDIVGDADTAYDKAVAIESAMRAVAYSLEVGPPPEDRDIVDYFLFDMDAGYCDYFATTMTVLARSVGVPARMATGYATGTYSDQDRAFVVTGMDAHAWVEVYFPDIGWVPFEPTPARTLIDRSPPPPVIASQRERSDNGRWGGIDLGRPLTGVVALLLAAGLGLWGVQLHRFNQLGPEDRVRTIYDTVWRRAGWFGWRGQASQTPQERVEALQGMLASRSVEVGLGGRRLTWRGADVVEDLRHLGLLFVKAQYSRQGVSPEEARAAWDAWHRVRSRLVLLWRDAR